MPQEPVSPASVHVDEYRQLEAQHHEYESRLGELAEEAVLSGEGQGGGHAERHRVGQAVVLRPELALGVREARDPPVEHVQDDGPADEGRGFGEAAVQRLHDRPEPEEEVPRREEARQDRAPPPEVTSTLQVRSSAPGVSAGGGRRGAQTAQGWAAAPRLRRAISCIRSLT